jgi:hypothetical protein
VKPFFRRSLPPLLGLCAVAVGCKLSKSPDCTPFPAPSLSGATCKALSAPTLLRDLGGAEFGGGDTPVALTVDDTAIYFTMNASADADPALFRMPKSGGVPLVLDDGVIAPIQVDGPTLVYTRLVSTPQSGGFSSRYPNVIQLGDQCLFETLPNAGGTRSVQGAPAVDGVGGVLWLASSSGSAPASILRWDPITATTSVVGSASSVYVTGFASDADHVYLAELTDSSTATTTIFAMPSTGGPQGQLASVPEQVSIAGVDSDSVYVAPAAFDGTMTGGSFTRIDKATGTITTLSDVSGSVANAVHDSNVYWALGDRVLRSPKAGGPSEVVLDLGDDSSTILAMAFDDCNIYIAGTFSSPPTSAGVRTSTSAIWGQSLSAATSATAPDASAPVGD